MSDIDEGNKEQTAQTGIEKRKANDLNGSEWTKFSISVWNDIRKNTDELRLKHPAIFPSALITRLLMCFTKASDTVVLDPFSGSGSTVLAAFQMKKEGIGFELNEEYVSLSNKRLSQGNLFSDVKSKIFNEDAGKISQFVDKDSVDICITSPPYWDVLSQKRTADNKEIRDYGSKEGDLSTISDYEEFLNGLKKVFAEVYTVLKPEKYCIVNVMDLRKGPNFYPFHSDLAVKMKEIGFIYDDIIIWDRRNEYNNLRALGYPAVFRLNKIHEYLLIFKKP